MAKSFNEGRPERLYAGLFSLPSGLASAVGAGGVSVGVAVTVDTDAEGVAAVLLLSTSFFF